MRFLLFLSVIVVGLDSSLPLPNNLPMPLPTPFAHENSGSRYVGRQAPPINPPDSFGTISPGGVCSQEQDCSGYPYAYCLGTCMCRDGAINAGSTCLEPGTQRFITKITKCTLTDYLILISGSSSRGNCGANQVYVSEAGACMNCKLL